MRSTPLLTLVALCCVVATVLAQSRPEGDLAGRVRALKIAKRFAHCGPTTGGRSTHAISPPSRGSSRVMLSSSGPGSPARGPAAIGAFLEKAISTNYPDSRGRNFHLYFNESIDVREDEGTGVSKGGFVMGSAENNKVDFLLLATYRDQFVREDGRWKFKRGEVIGEIPVPRAAPR